MERQKELDSWWNSQAAGAIMTPFQLWENTIPYYVHQFKWSFLVGADWNVLTYTLYTQYPISFPPQQSMISEIILSLPFRSNLSSSPHWESRIQGLICLIHLCGSKSLRWCLAHRRGSINIPWWMKAWILTQIEPGTQLRKNASLLNHLNDNPSFPILIYFTE